MVRSYPSHVIPAESQVEAAAKALNKGKKVTILAGAGTEGAHDELIAIADKLQAPIVHALRGKEFVEYDNPFDVGMTGLLGFSSGYHALKGCDTLLMLGTDLPYQQFYPEDATVIQVDVRGSQIGRRTPVDIGLVGTVADTVDSLLPLIKGHRSSISSQDDDQALCEDPQGARRTRHTVEAHHPPAVPHPAHRRDGR